MAHYKSLSKKMKLAKAGTHTKWAPFWTIFKAYGKGKRIHPSRLTHIKRSWKGRRLKIKPRRITKTLR